MEQQDSNLSTRIQDLAHRLLGKDFQFRQGQVEAIESIVNNVLLDVKHTVLEAPTGSGKSIVAIIAAYVLHKVYKRTTYILVSDLSLFDQYVHDIERLNDIECFGYIKGKENYTCNANGCKVSQAACSLQGVSIAHASFNKKSAAFWCASTCKYAHDYVKAIKAPITLMTYQLYFIQRNYVEDCIFNGRNSNFPKRDLAICDEAHKICDICQSHFAPRVSITRPSWMDTLSKHIPGMPSESARLHALSLIELSADNYELLRGVKAYEEHVAMYCAANEMARRKLANARHLSKQEKQVLAAGNTARQEHCKLEDMLSFIDELKSPEYIVKTTIDDEITINFVFDNLMLEKYLHKKSSCELLMSATIGDFKEYAKLAGLDQNCTSGLSMPSTFDFSESPIYVSQNNKMSASTKEQSLAAISKQVASICQANSQMRGIIQTGSYANSMSLMASLPTNVRERCLLYSSTNEKKLAIDAYIASTNGILVGPTLVEGLNFPDDLCRFQICIKVPYAYLGSEYVRKKMANVSGWYEYDVINKICQGIGRGVRHKDDWCKTYILDGCIMNLLNKLEDIPTLSHRFKLYE